MTTRRGSLSALVQGENQVATLVLFDFDGTITRSDSMFDFIRFTVGNAAFVVGIAKLSLVLLAYRLGITRDARSAKQALLRLFFNNWSVHDFNQAGAYYALTRLPKIVRANAVSRIRAHQALGHKVVVVTASIENWLRVWCDELDVQLIGSRLKEVNGVITGELLGENCNGAEKVNRINLEFNLRNYDQIYAYGDTEGDGAMLRLATAAFYRAF